MIGFTVSLYGEFINGFINYITNIRKSILDV